MWEIERHCNQLIARKKRVNNGRFFSTVSWAVWAGVGVVANAAIAQEVLRLSLANDAFTQTHQQASATLGYYNLLMGPATWRFNSGLSTEYNNNVHVQNSNPQGDVVFRPNLDASIHWPLTENNSLDAGLGLGYSLYSKNSDLNQFTISPGSGTAFNVYVGDFTINLHDQISILENGTQTPGNAGNSTGNNARLQNVIGSAATWNLNQAQAMLDYDHANYAGLGSMQSIRDGQSENISAAFGVHIRPEIIVGVEGGGGLYNYAKSSNISFFSPDAKQWNAGAFCSAQISEHITARFDAGYTELLPDAVDASFDAADAKNFYFQTSVTHIVNAAFNYSLSAGRSLDFQFYGQPYSHYFVRVQPNWTFLQKYTLSTPFSWEDGTQVYQNTVNFNQFSGAIQLGRQITKHLSATIYDRLTVETSSQTAYDYTVNIVGLSIIYQF